MDFCTYQAASQNNTYPNLTFLELFSHFKVLNNIHELQPAVPDLKNLVLGGGGGSPRCVWEVGVVNAS